MARAWGSGQIMEQRHPQVLDDGSEASWAWTWASTDHSLFPLALRVGSGVPVTTLSSDQGSSDGV
eukprot:5053797-Pyramimonas_sp.AAC.1